jgi:hypothetical protein
MRGRMLGGALIAVSTTIGGAQAPAPKVVSPD